MGALVAQQEYQVTVEVYAGETAAAAAVEDELERLVDALIKRADGLALGPAGAIHGSTLEVGFTVEASDAADMYSKLHKVALILADAGTASFAATAAFDVPAIV